jgi:hypothetical protein
MTLHVRMSIVYGVPTITYIINKIFLLPSSPTATAPHRRDHET